MTITFYKYQGTGNDFIVIDNRLQIIDKNDVDRIAALCDRRFGIGADGFILLENDETSDFKMVYFNADGNESSMCGNGGRCMVAFAKFLGLIKSTTTFNAIDGLHNAKIRDGVVHLQMQNVPNIIVNDTFSFLNTGSPHHVELVKDIANYDVKTKGAALRYGDLYNEAGSNINFAEQQSKDCFVVRTYERGVEDETLSCGTGVTAVALAMHKNGKLENDTVRLKTLGGELQVTFTANRDGYNNIWLIGPAEQVFKGTIIW